MKTTSRFVLLCLTVWLAACGQHDPPVPVNLPTVTVRVEQVTSAEIPIFEEVVGTVRPRLDSAVSAKATGRIARMLATPGMRVSEGDVLVELDVAEARAALERARAASEATDSDLNRYRRLLASGAATQAEFDRVQAQQRIAAATVKENESFVSNAIISAPFSGTITRKFAEIGDLAAPGRPLFAMEDATLLRLEIDVAESLAGSLSLEQKLTVEVAGAGATLEGTTSEIAPSAEAASRTFLVKLDLPSHDNLRAGQFGRAFLPRGAREALLVPVSSVFSRGQLDYVFVSNPAGLANLRIVRTGGRNGARIEVLAGVEPGELVVLDPAPALRDGNPVEVEK